MRLNRAFSCLNRSVVSKILCLVIMVFSSTEAVSTEAARNPNTILPLIASQRENLRRQLKAKKHVEDAKDKWEKEKKEAQLSLDSEEKKDKANQNPETIKNLKDRIQKAEDALNKNDPNPPDGYDKKNNGGLNKENVELSEQIEQSKADIKKLTELNKGLQDAEKKFSETERAQWEPNQQDESSFDRHNESQQELTDAKAKLGDEINRQDANGNGIADTGEKFDANRPSTPVNEANSNSTSNTNGSAQSSSPSLNLENQLGNNNNNQLADMAAVSEGRAAAGPELAQRMGDMESRAKDQSLAGPITGKSDGGWKSNEGQAWVNGELKSGRIFEDRHGGGRYFVPNDAYGNKGLDGYMQAKSNDLSGLHQLNGSIASGNATRVGNNIHFDGFYNGSQVVQNSVWNAPSSGNLATRSTIPFSRSQGLTTAPLQASPRIPATPSNSGAASGLTWNPYTWGPALSKWWNSLK